MSTFRRSSASSSLTTQTDLITSSSTLSTSPSSTSTSSTPSSTAYASHDQSNVTPQTAVIVAILLILVLSCVAVIGFIVYRRRHFRHQEQRGYERHSAFGGYNAELDNRPSTTSRSVKRPGAVDQNHVAARISPYGSSTNLVPRFNHSPGNDMRIATRRPDGGWEFSTPGSVFNPSGVDEIEPPASASTSMYTPTPTKSTFRVPMTPSFASIHSPFPPTPETPSFPPGLPPAVPPKQPSLPPSTPTTPITPQNATSFPASSSSALTISLRPASQLTTSSMEPPKSPAQIMKESESRAARLIRQGYDDREFSDEAPPPAYGHDPCYLDTNEPNPP